jgi:transcriptional regulator with XRE-family HTH domain
MAYSGIKIAHLLKERGIKAKVFFEYVYPGRSGNSSFHDIERNDNPSAKAIERIADLLDCSIDELFDREPTAATSGDHIEADNNSMAFKGTSTCDPRLLSMIETRDRQMDKCQAQLDKAQEQIDRAQQQSDRLLSLLEGTGRN